MNVTSLPEGKGSKRENKCDRINLKSLRTAKATTNETKKATNRMGEGICKW